LNGNCDFAHATRNDQALFEMNLEAEADVDAAQLEEAAAKRTAGESGWSEFREETATANQNLSSPAGDNGDFVRAIFCIVSS